MASQRSSRVRSSSSWRTVRKSAAAFLSASRLSKRLGKILDGLPNHHTPWTALFLPLRFAVGLLQLGRRNRSEDIVARLEHLEEHPELRPFYQWFGGLADALWGYRRDVLGFAI